MAGASTLALLLGAGSVHDAAALNETRTLTFHHTHSGEDLTVTFKRDGRYDDEALKALNHLLRDWRTQDETVMDRHLFDVIWEVYRDVDARQPIQIISAYRSPATNAMLRHRSAHSGVARFSQHMLGHAMDLYIPGVSLEQIRYAGLRLQRGGVGFYPASGSPFVHLDTGNIRHWPRMTHDELAKVFPDGRTVHVPSDGVPLKGYELARAEIERRGGDDAIATGKPSFLAVLFRGKSNEEEDDATVSVETNDKPRPAAITTVSKPASGRQTEGSRVKSQFAAALRLAAADAAPLQTSAESQPVVGGSKSDSNTERRPETPADIINARGFWGDEGNGMKPATRAEAIAAFNARRARESIDPQTTAATSAALDAMAYVPNLASPDSSHTTTTSAPIPPAGPYSSAHNTIAMDPTASNGSPSAGGPIVMSTRIAAANADGTWLRIVILSPSVGASMQVTVLGDADLSLMRAFFVKPASVLESGFTEDPVPGMSSDHFAGSSVAKPQTIPFALRTAER